MGYVDYTYYLDYTEKMPPVIDKEVWDYWERQAEGEIDKKTSFRLQKDPGLISEPVKRCVCEIAEILYKAAELSEQARQQGSAGLLASYSNDGESGTYDLKSSPYTEEGKAGRIREILYRHLAFTGLLYAGVR